MADSTASARKRQDLDLHPTLHDSPNKDHVLRAHTNAIVVAKPKLLSTVLPSTPKYGIHGVQIQCRDTVVVSEEEAVVSLAQEQMHHVSP